MPAVGGGEDAALQQPGEVVLGQVQGLVGVVPLAADEGVERIPVGAAELGQRLAGLGRDRVAGRDDPAPAGRREAGRRRVGSAIAGSTAPKLGEITRGTTPGPHLTPLYGAIRPASKPLDPAEKSVRAWLGVR